METILMMVAEQLFLELIKRLPPAAETWLASPLGQEVEKGVLALCEEGIQDLGGMILMRWEAWKLAPHVPAPAPVPTASVPAAPPSPVLHMTAPEVRALATGDVSEDEILALARLPKGERREHLGLGAP